MMSRHWHGVILCIQQSTYLNENKSMINHIRQIKKLALEMRNKTSRNDARRERMQEICDLVDELQAHHIDDGR